MDNPVGETTREDELEFASSPEIEREDREEMEAEDSAFGAPAPDPFDEVQAALDVVGATIAANAQLLGEEPAIHAGLTREGQIALFRNTDPDVPAMVLGSPNHAVGYAQRAHRKALKAHPPVDWERCEGLEDTCVLTAGHAGQHARTEVR